MSVSLWLQNTSILKVHLENKDEFFFKMQRLRNSVFLLPLSHLFAEKGHILSHFSKCLVEIF